MANKASMTRLSVNKELTCMINVRSFVRRGWPLLPLFVNLHLGLFKLRVLNSEQCSGFLLGNLEVKVTS